MKKFWFTAVFCAVFMPLSVSAQSIDIGELGEASAYDIGLIAPGNGAMDAALWQGTSASMAARLINDAPLGSDNPAVQKLLRAAILSGGVPPENANPETLADYNAARFKAVMALGDKTMLETYVQRTPRLASDPVAAANIALASGDTEAACYVADGISEGRGTPQWARLRAFCHVLRDELSAAELTSDLLKNSGYEDPIYFDLMKMLTGVSKRAKLDAVGDDPLYVAMADAAKVKWPEGKIPAAIAAKIALDGTVHNDLRLNALYNAGSALSNEQMGAILSSFTYDETDPLGGSYDFDSIKSETTAKSAGQLYTLMRPGGADDQAVGAAAELLKRADSQGAFNRFSDFLADEISVIRPEAQAQTDITLFTRAAVNRGDLGTLQGLYRAMDGHPAQERIALISDALGNGFIMGELGQDIETRLAESGPKKTRAVRDAVIALGLGSRLSETAATALAGAGNGAGRKVRTGELLALQAAAKEGSRAETTLRAAVILEPGGARALDNLSLYTVIHALSDAGLTSLAGQVAAGDFMAGLGE